jgi:hypothetical protein
MLIPLLIYSIHHWPHDYTLSFQVPAAMYSDSLDDSATVGCFHDNHAMAPSPRYITYPPVDLRFSVSPAKSASEYSLKTRTSPLSLSSQVLSCI